MSVCLRDGVVHIKTQDSSGAVIDNPTDAKAVVRALVHYLIEAGIETSVLNGHVTFKHK